MTNLALGDLCDFAATQVDPAANSALPYIGLEHVVTGRFDVEATGTASDVTSSKYLFKAGDVLYGKLRPYLDKAVIATGDGLCTTELLVLRPKSDVDARFLAAVVHSQQFIDHAMAGVTGAQHPRTSWPHLRDFSLPAFDPEAQAKIASVASIVQAGIRSCEATLNSATALKRAAMRELFTRGLRGGEQTETEFGLVPALWDAVVLDDMGVVQTGAAKGRQLGDVDTVEVPYLRVANVQDGHLDLSDMKTIKIRQSEIERYRLRNGDVVLTEGGDFDKLGRGFIWNGELDLCVHQNHVFAVRPDSSRLIPKFFAYQCQSPYGKAYFLKVAHKTTNLACINSTKLKAFPALVPPDKQEQLDIVEILEAIDQKIELGKRKKAVLEELFRALLHKLMSGELHVSDLDLSALHTAAQAETRA